MLPRLLSSVWLLLALPVAAGAQIAPSRQATAPHTRVDLIASAPAVKPGADFWVGLRFQLDEGWHIYWVNPGDSGTAPMLDWQLPAGYRAGDVVWPAPQRIPSGTLVNYGYEGAVVLPVPLRVPAGAQPDEPALVSLQAKWLICRDVCVPGQARLALSLPLGAADRTEAPGWARLIDDARGRVPKPAPATWRARAVAQKDVFVLTVDTGRREAAGVFFPLEVSQVNDSAPQVVRPLERGLEITLRKSDQLVKDPRQLKGVLALPETPAYVVVAPVEGGQAPAR